MKYRAKKLSTGEWAVFAGSKYFTSTVTDNKKEAEQQALIKSIQWYEDMKRDAWEELLKISETDKYENECKPIGYDCFVNLGDLLC